MSRGKILSRVLQITWLFDSHHIKLVGCGFTFSIFSVYFTVLPPIFSIFLLKVYYGKLWRSSLVSNFESFRIQKVKTNVFLNTSFYMTYGLTEMRNKVLYCILKTIFGLFLDISSVYFVCGSAFYFAISNTEEQENKYKL